jgi:hypothetical protein
LGLNRKQTVAVGLMVVLRTRPLAIGQVFGSLETEGILGIELGANSAKGEISVVLGDMMI